MTVIESATVVNKPIDQVYTYLADLNNHQQLMPDNIYNWTSTADEATFTIQNMAKLSIKIASRVENKELIAVPSEEAPFAIEMKWTVEDNGDGTTTAKHILSADLNMMMKMLASGPLQKLVDHQTARLTEILN
ncbi:SRPBCC family protein [Pedobacter sp. MC2016-15]|uniref:SRPBCC family protein n=1 Tax=Pedobacter sp. MC2016-15 TaxID=2994473 RepID=UPI002247CD6E|nr:SRPBCC family protein [Pedobacter sp. MC2016-15]MCX2480176.1 SRPBCC family protein [Pedobacter sp. MC2016-15]